MTKFLGNAAALDATRRKSPLAQAFDCFQRQLVTVDTKAVDGTLADRLNLGHGASGRWVGGVDLDHRELDLGDGSLDGPGGGRETGRVDDPSFIAVVMGFI